jgi:hypothetical protein
VVLGAHPETAIEASQSILFLKNELIERYVELVAARNANAKDRDGGGQRPGDTYVSPRTKAASRDVLNASALLHHRSRVVREDLHALRYTLTMVPGNDRAGTSSAEDLFAKALQSVQQSYTDADLQMVEELMTIEQTFSLYLHGASLEAQPSHRGLLRLFLGLIGKSSWRDVSLETFTEALRSKQITNPRVNELRDEILDDVLEHAPDGA